MRYTNCNVILVKKTCGNPCIGISDLYLKCILFHKESF